MVKLFSDIPCLQSERITVRKLTPQDADGLRELTDCAEVYRFLPTFLFEKKYDDAQYVISKLYSDECLKTSLIPGFFSTVNSADLPKYTDTAPRF